MYSSWQQNYFIDVDNDDVISSALFSQFLSRVFSEYYPNDPPRIWCGEKKFPSLINVSVELCAFKRATAVSQSPYLCTYRRRARFQDIPRQSNTREKEKKKRKRKREWEIKNGKDKKKKLYINIYYCIGKYANDIRLMIILDEYINIQVYKCGERNISRFFKILLCF